MCFSAHASFAASAVLVGTGMAAMRSAKVPSQKPFAAIPLIFAVQQGCEGLLWLSLSNPALSPWHAFPMHIYFFIAMAVWPLWLPFSVWLMEEVPSIKQKLMLPLAIGGLVFAYYALAQIMLGVQVNIACFHVEYMYEYPGVSWALAAYLLAVALPLFRSSWRYMPIVGGTLLLSLAVSMLFYRSFSLSVWCFFAAILSVQVLWLLVAHQAPQGQEWWQRAASRLGGLRH